MRGKQIVTVSRWLFVGKGNILETKELENNYEGSWIKSGTLNGGRATLRVIDTSIGMELCVHYDVHTLFPQHCLTASKHGHNWLLRTLTVSFFESCMAWLPPIFSLVPCRSTKEILALHQRDQNISVRFLH